MLLQHPGYPGRIRGPGGEWLSPRVGFFIQLVQVEGNRLAQVLGSQVNQAVVAREGESFETQLVVAPATDVTLTAQPPEEGAGVGE